MSRTQSILNKAFASIDSLTIRYASCGKDDGEKDIPHEKSSDIRGHELDVIHLAQKVWSEYKAASLEDRTLLTTELQQCRAQIDEGTQAKKNIEVERTKGHRNLELEHGLSSGQYIRMKEVYDQSSQELKELQDLLKRPLMVSMQKYYIPLMLSLSFAEVPLNKLSFELFFEGMPLAMYAMATAIGALFLFFSHIAGLNLRRTQCEYTATRKLQVYVAFSLLLIFVLGLIFGLGHMRDEMLKLQNPTLNLASLLVQGAPPEGEGSLFVLSQGAWASIGINIAIVACGTITAFLRHDPHPHYEEVVLRHKSIQSEIDSYESNFSKKNHTLSTQYDQRLSLVENELRKNQGRFEKLRNKDLEFENEVKMDKAKLVANFSRVISAYRRANEVARVSAAPTYFNSNIESELSLVIV